MKMAFTEAERAVDETLGYPKAYAKLCKSPNVLNPYSHGPPFTFLPYLLQPQEALKIKDLNEMFPILDPDAVPSLNPKGFVNLLWKQLDHLGNAGFDPGLFRVDPFGNVLYLHADSASPLAWDIDHWFPCSRGGKTILSNLRIVNSQVCTKKGNKLEFLIPWWDLQIGISVNQFLNIFASKNSDFRKRAFSYLFLNGSNEELNTLQSVEAHSFPKNFNEAKNKLGLAPAGIVSIKNNSDSVLKQVDFNSRASRPTYPCIAAKKNPLEKIPSKENPTNPHLQISLARDSLIQKNQAKKKNQAEIDELDKKIEELNSKNEQERESIRNAEQLLIKKKKRAEKCRQLAESQAQYKSLLEKMIRDAMHQSVIYKEQLRLNQAATSALMARLEAQRSICDNSQNALRKKFKIRDQIQYQISPNQARKRSRIDRENNDFNHEINDFDDENNDFNRENNDFDYDFNHENKDFNHGNNDLRNNRFNYRKNGRKNLTKKELREFLEEEQRNSRRFSIVDKKKLQGGAIKNELQNRAIYRGRGRDSLYDKLETLSLRDEKLQDYNCGKTESEIEQEEFMSEIGEKLQGFESESEMEEELQNRAIVSRSNMGRNRSSSLVESETFSIRDEKLHGFAIENEIEEEEEEEFINERNNKLDVKGKKLQNYAIDLGENYEIEEINEEYINQIGKGNVDKWLQMLVNNSDENIGTSYNNNNNNNNSKIIENKQNESDNNVSRKRFDMREKESTRAFRSLENEQNIGTNNNNNGKILKNKQNESDNNNMSRKSFDIKENLGLQRSDSARAFRSLPSSPSKIILGMKKGVDCIGRKPKVIGEDEEFVGGYNGDYNNRKFVKAVKKALIK